MTFQAGSLGRTTKPTFAGGASFHTGAERPSICYGIRTPGITGVCVARIGIAWVGIPRVGIKSRVGQATIFGGCVGGGRVVVAAADGERKDEQGG
jgi:hypothetical protein